MHEEHCPVPDPNIYTDSDTDDGYATACSHHSSGSASYSPLTHLPPARSLRKIRDGNTPLISHPASTTLTGNDSCKMTVAPVSKDTATDSAKSTPATVSAESSPAKAAKDPMEESPMTTTLRNALERRLFLNTSERTHQGPRRRSRSQPRPRGRTAARPSEEDHDIHQYANNPDTINDVFPNLDIATADPNTQREMLAI